MISIPSICYQSFKSMWTRMGAKMKALFADVNSWHPPQLQNNKTKKNAKTILIYAATIWQRKPHKKRASEKKLPEFYLNFKWLEVLHQPSPLPVRPCKTSLIAYICDAEHPHRPKTNGKKLFFCWNRNSKWSVTFTTSCESRVCGGRRRCNSGIRHHCRPLIH